MQDVVLVSLVFKDKNLCLLMYLAMFSLDLHLCVAQ